MDNLTPQQRRKTMQRVRSTDTAPELLVRRTLHRLGYRFRLHRKDLPGCPDIVFPGRKKLIFVHGCFWHRHEGCPDASMPASRLEYWKAKFNRTVERDTRAVQELQEAGWATLVIWTCELKDRAELERRLLAFLEG
ncbi:very short patch repair endonuclease [Paraburkholderia tropica]|uniref:very short patch repair endonuclease n=1 Tax=Paraburkholderia tropica TaxID=92647 RepID=UPI0009440E06|nr:DNA mismatch endonuclease Vsr [Paraburkholderia tropica]RQN35685.1 DNA mismatch endonuclease Vsr [Paraburkholderia tropica]